jgi:aryl-alcohol dehydrogenase-like predicted oxidoreductase
MSGMPRRSFVNSKKLPSSVSIVGLGCSSFSTFYWTEDELKDDANLVKTHPRVQEWIRTITYAVTDVGITLLDTAPWYVRLHNLDVTGRS